MRVRGARRLAGILVLNLVCAGCAWVSFGYDEQVPTSSEKLSEAKRTGFVRFDLRTPPSRAEGGMFEGEDTTFYDRRKPFDLEVLLPEDHVLRLHVDSVYVNAPVAIGRQPSTEPPEELLIKSRGDAPAVRDLLLAVAREYGIAVERIENWAAYANPRSVPSASVRSETGYLSTKVGYLTLTLKGVYRPEGDEAVASISLYWRTPRAPVGEFQ